MFHKKDTGNDIYEKRPIKNNVQQRALRPYAIPM